MTQTPMSATSTWMIRPGQQYQTRPQVAFLGPNASGTLSAMTVLYDLENERADAAVNAWDNVPDQAALDAYIRKSYAPHYTILPPTRLGVGEYHPRIERLGGPKLRDLPDVEREAFLMAAASSTALFDDMNRLFHFVDPQPANEGAFGHAMRHLLILACTEVETCLKGILRANGYAPTKTDKHGTVLPIPEKDWKTQDYVKLMPVMRLGEYEVRLPLHPTWPVLKPFEDWAPQAPGPTDTIPWYRAYHDTKHDRDTNLRRATLKDAISALSALYVLMVASWGDAFGPKSHVDTGHFVVTKRPPLRNHQDVYVSAVRGVSSHIPWTPVPYF